MIPQRWIEAYLRFLLRYRGTVTIAVVLLTALFCVALRSPGVKSVGIPVPSIVFTGGAPGMRFTARMR